MNTVKLIQTRLNALRDTVVEETTIGEFKNVALAEDFLTKRGYTFDTVEQAWICGNTVQFPVRMEVKEASIFDIGSFV